MKQITTILCCWLFVLINPIPAEAHSNGATSIHEIDPGLAPKISLAVEKDPTGGFNVQVVTSNFVWRPEMASMEHVPGEGHAHVYLDGRKIMRIYNGWFHLNTYQFSTRAGEQLLSVEFVGNDHAPYTVQGLPVGAEQIVDVPQDEIQPASEETDLVLAGLISILLLTVGALLLWRFRAK